MPFGSALLAHRRFFWIAVSIGVLLGCSTLGIGFLLDDYAFVSWLDGAGPRRVTPFDLYEFGLGDRALNYEMVRGGPWPWWADPELKVRFFRPLSSALLWLDHALFGHAPFGYHAHAVLWFAALLLAAGLLFRSALSSTIYPLTFLLFAVNGGHAESVGWISARHMIVAAAPAVAGLAAYVAYRERGFRAGRWLVVPGVVIGLAGGETAVGVLLYWLAYEAVGAPEQPPWLARVRRMWLPLGIAVTYFVAYKAAGYGAAHSDAYLDPLAEPVRFSLATLPRVPLLLGELLGGVSCQFAQLLSVGPFVAIGLVAVAVFSALVGVVWPAVPAEDRRALYWLGTGAMLALLAAVGAFPGSRLLLLPGLGGCAFIAAIVVYGAKRLAEPALGRGARVGIRAGRAFLIAAHLVLSPLMFVGSVPEVTGLAASTARIDRSLDGTLGGEGAPATAAHRVFLLAASDPVGGLYVGAARAMRAPQTVSAWVPLSLARATHRIERIDERRLVISADPGMLHGSFEVVFRGGDHPLRPGDRVDLDDVSVAVLATEGRFPTSIEVSFRTIPIEDPSVVFLIWRDGALAPVRLLPGERIVVPWSKGPTGFF
jgi:hypothetical protein